MARAAAFLFFLPCLLPAEDLPAYHVERVASNLKFTEGPVWSRDGYLLFSDIPANLILKLVPGSGAPATFRENSGGANGNVFDEKGRLYTCEEHARRVTRTDKKGNVEVLAERYEGKRLNSPNDIVVGRSGHVYFTDPAFGKAQDTRELDFYGVYHLSPKGELKLIAKPAGRPNGIAFSPNGRILYVANSDERNIRAYDVDHSGDVSNERVLVSSMEGVPDGLRTDEKGNLYVAAKDVIVYSPEGKQTATIPIPEGASNCAFGDTDMQTLYVTARTSVFRIRLEGVKGSVQY
jgi:gluconolactonase